MVSTRRTTLDERRINSQIQQLITPATTLNDDDKELLSRIQQHIERSRTPSPVPGETPAHPQYVNGSDSDNSEAATSRSASSRNHRGPPLYVEPDGTSANPFVFNSTEEMEAKLSELRRLHSPAVVKFCRLVNTYLGFGPNPPPLHFYFDYVDSDSDSDSDSSRTLGSQDTWSGSSTGSVDTDSSFKPSLAESDGSGGSSYGPSTESDSSSIEYPISMFQGENFFENIPLTYNILATLDQPSLVFQYAAFNGIDMSTLSLDQSETLCEGATRAFQALGPLRRRRAAERRIRRR
jgi:hypothetical protein